MTRTIRDDLKALDAGLQEAYQKGIKAKEEGKSIKDITFVPMEPYIPSECVKEQSRLQAESYRQALEDGLRSDILYC